MVSQNDRRTVRAPGITLALELAAFAIASALGAACTARSPRPAAAPEPAQAILGLDGQPDTREDAVFVETVRRECSVCHVAGRASDLPRAQWRQRLQDMARFSLTHVGVPGGRESRLAQLDLEPFVRYFEARAPQTLAAPEPWPAPAVSTGFQRTTFSPKGAAPVPIVADARFFDLDGDGRLEIVACDMGHGLVFAGDPSRRPGELREIAKVANPVRASLADLDEDGDGQVDRWEKREGSDKEAAESSAARNATWCTVPAPVCPRRNPPIVRTSTIVPARISSPCSPRCACRSSQLPRKAGNT